MRCGVLVLNMGGPETQAEVRPFLFRFFCDRAILRVPFLLRVCLAFLISSTRAKKARESYARMGGGSPLLAETQRQAEKLQRILEDRNPGRFYVAIGMRYSKPSVKEALAALKKEGCDQIILFPMYPQYSTTTTQSSFDVFDRQNRKFHFRNARIRSYPALDGFVRCFVEEVQRISVKKGFEKARILLSAHGLPEKIVESGDPYVEECRKTVDAFQNRIGGGHEIRLCFQSKVGPMAWTKPSLIDEIRQAGQDGVAVVVVPISFVSEHIETIVECGMEVREMAEKCGVPAYDVAETPRDKDLFLNDCAKLIEEMEKSGF